VRLREAVPSLANNDANVFVLKENKTDGAKMKHLTTCYPKERRQIFGERIAQPEENSI
jgi:hypothetical protein